MYSKVARAKVLSTLPQKAVDLVSEIEEFAGTEIGFQDYTILKMAGSKDTDSEAIYADHTRAYVSVPDLDSINSMAVVHELLHLKRYWIDGVPQMEAKDDRGSNVELAAAIDNCLEHLVIVPLERDYGFDPGPHWLSESEKHWADFPWPNYPPMAQRMHALIGWLTTSLVNDAPHKAAIRTKLDSISMSGEAERLHSRVMSLLNSKPRTVSAVLRFLKVPRHAVELVVLDVRNKRQIRLPIPEH